MAPVARREFCHSTFFSVLDKSSIGAPFIFSLTTGPVSVSVGQQPAMSSQALRPMRSASDALSMSTARALNSSSTRCQSISRWGPSTEPSSETDL